MSPGRSRRIVREKRRDGGLTGALCTVTNVGKVTGSADDTVSLQAAQSAHGLDHGVRGLVPVGAAGVPMRLTESISGAAVGAVLFTTMPLLLACLYLPALMRQRAFWSVYLMSGMCIGMGYTLYAVGLLLGSVSKTTVLFYLTPIWSTLLGMFFLGEKPGSAAGQPSRWQPSAAAS